MVITNTLSSVWQSCLNSSFSILYQKPIIFEKVEVPDVSVKDVVVAAVVISLMDAIEFETPACRIHELA